MWFTIFADRISDIQGRPCSLPIIFSWNSYLLSGPIPVGVVCMGGLSDTAVALPGGWWCACESCHVRSVSIQSRLFQIHSEAVYAVSGSFLMVDCLMRGAKPIAFKNFTVDCPTKPRQPTSTRYTWHFQPLPSIWFFRLWYFVAFLSWARSMLASHGTVSSVSITERSVSDHITMSGHRRVWQICSGNLKALPRSTSTVHSDCADPNAVRPSSCLLWTCGCSSFLSSVYRYLSDFTRPSG